MNDMRSLKGAFPFRLGTTSYIIPDDIVPNVRFLADKVDDVELVLFESDEVANIPSAAVVGEIDELAREHGLTYTIHLPLDIHTGHAEETERRRSVDKCRRIIDRMAPLNPAAYLLHLDGDRRGGEPSDDIPRWQARHYRSVCELVAAVPPEKICIETLDYPFELAAEIVDDLGLGICLDLGHLLLYGYDVHQHIDAYLQKTGVIHLHGIKAGKDHSPIGYLDREFLAELWDELVDRYRNILTLEIFGQTSFQKSIDTLQGLVRS
jgi:sugar phosphate isomerase/epimerase